MGVKWVIKNPASQQDALASIKSIYEAAKIIGIPLKRSEIYVLFDGKCTDAMIAYIEKFGCNVESENYYTQEQKGN